MNILGIIVEYNPFHNGHLYHLEKSKEITKSNYTIAVMSGNFVQRGEPAIIDKWTRAKMAIDSGVDLVVELPTIYAIQSAEFFAYGAVKTLNSTGIVNSIVFGSEIGSLEILDIIATLLVEEPIGFKKSLKKHLSHGVQFPLARSRAIKDYLDNSSMIDTIDLDIILNSSNNILAIEYLKALKKLNSKIQPFTIKRIGESYNSKKMVENISSATAIRNRLLHYEDFDSIKMAVPKSTFNYLKHFFNQHHSFNILSNYDQVLLYLLRTTDKEKLKEILDVDEGLENRIVKCAIDFNSINETLNCINTKRYTLTRLQRIMTHLLLGLSQKDFMSIYTHTPVYLRVLASNKKGLEILNYIKKNSTVPIITKFASIKQLDDKIIHKSLEYDIKATNIYYLGLTKYDQTKVNLDFSTNPYIKKTSNKIL